MSARPRPTSQSPVSLAKLLTGAAAALEGLAVALSPPLRVIAAPLTAVALSNERRDSCKRLSFRSVYQAFKALRSLKAGTGQEIPYIYR